MANQQNTRIRVAPGKRIERLRSVKAPRKRRICLQGGLLLNPRLHPPLLGGERSGLLRANLGTHQDRREADLGTPECNPGKARLAFPARGQPALGIGAGAVGLRVGVS